MKYERLLVKSFAEEFGEVVIFFYQSLRLTCRMISTRCRGRDYARPLVGAAVPSLLDCPGPTAVGYLVSPPGDSRDADVAPIPPGTART